MPVRLKKRLVPWEGAPGATAETGVRRLWKARWDEKLFDKKNLIRRLPYFSVDSHNAKWQYYLFSQ